MIQDSIITIEIDIPPLAKREESIFILDKMIQDKKQFLLEKRNALHEMERKNEYLQTVQQDYEKYYNHIVEEKQTQLRYMDYLTKYMEDIMREGKLREEDLIRAEWEQKKIIMEITKIKDELDEMIGN